MILKRSVLMLRSSLQFLPISLNMVNRATLVLPAPCSGQEALLTGAEPCGGRLCEPIFSAIPQHTIKFPSSINHLQPTAQFNPTIHHMGSSNPSTTQTPPIIPLPNSAHPCTTHSRSTQEHIVVCFNGCLCHSEFEWRHRYCQYILI